MLVVGNEEGFAEVFTKFAEPMVLVILAAELLKKGDLKQESDIAKAILKYEQALKGKHEKQNP